MSHNELFSDAQNGKMFGVLVVTSADSQELFFLAAYSGLLAGRNDWSWFVPPVFDAQQPDGHFKQTERQLTAMNTVLETLDSDSRLAIDLKEHRRQTSEELQRWLFQQYNMLNALDVQKKS